MPAMTQDVLPKDRQAAHFLESPDTGEDLGQYIAIEGADGPQDVEVTPDGGLIITIGQPYENAETDDDEFFANLAKVIPDEVQFRIATDLIRRIETDKEDRKKRDEQYEEGIRRTGLGNDAPGGATFNGASRVVHPMMTEACIDFTSRIMKELWPIAGPAKPKIIGVPTKEKAERAKRKVEYVNYQLTEQIKEARSVFETMLTQLGLGGSQYIRQYWDHRLKRAAWEFVPVDKVYLPFGAESYYSAKRKTFADTINSVQLRERMDSGLYRKLDGMVPPSVRPEPTKAEKANQKIDGVDESGTNLDGDREIYETQVVLEVTEDMAAVLKVEQAGDLCPYIITIDVTTKRVLGFYRDWERDDETREPIDHLYQFEFLPWRGPYKVGLPHVIGGLSGAATGALRALLDSAHIANTQGGLILKGSGTGPQTRQAQIGEFVEIDSNMETDDIRKKIMPFASREPSAVLFQLLGFLTEAGKGSVRTSLDESAIDTNANTPVGTQLSRVEEGLVVFSSIHGRVHAAFDRLLKGLHRLNRLYMPEYVRVDASGKEILARRKDFEGPLDVQPVSDPTIYSDQQRMAQVTAMQQRAAVAPGLYNIRAVEKKFLELMKIADPESYLSKSPEPHELNAVNENLALAFGQPVVAFPEQEHIAHLQTHLDFLSSPIFGMQSPVAVLNPGYIIAAVKHCVEHMVYAYVKLANETVKGASGVDASALMSDDYRVKATFDRLMAVVSERVAGLAPQVFGQVMPILQRAMQMAQASAPKPPMDPAMAAVQAAGAETARKSAADQSTAQLAAAKQQSDNAFRQAQLTAQEQRNAIDMQRNQTSADNAQLQAASRLRQTEMETESAQDIAAMKIESGGDTRLSDGASLGG